MLTKAVAVAQVELVKGGRDMPVTDANKLQYIHRVADYRLNVQLASAAGAFRAGFTSIIAPDWVAMFSEEELQACSSQFYVPHFNFL